MISLRSFLPAISFFLAASFSRLSLAQAPANTLRVAGLKPRHAARLSVHQTSRAESNEANCDVDSVTKEAR